MTTTTDRPALVCPFWCTNHEDMNKPHPKNEAALATYDETVDGHFVHASDTIYQVSDIEVSVSTCTDWHGHDTETPRVFVAGRDLTVDEARDMAKAINAACGMLAGGPA